MKARRSGLLIVVAKRFLADNKPILFTITSFVIALSIFSGVNIYAESAQAILKEKYNIIDLGGNTPGIWPTWHVADERALNVRIFGSEPSFHLTS